MLDNEPPLRDLLPHGLSDEGFLMSRQTLADVIARDAKALEVLNYSYSEIADLLEPVCQPNVGTEFQAQNDRIYRVRVEVYRGWQNCPWRDVDYPKGSGIDIFLGQGSDQRRIAGMLPHLIRNHRFFEGGSYRFAPEDIVSLFGTERVSGSLDKARAIVL